MYEREYSSDCLRVLKIVGSGFEYACTYSMPRVCTFVCTLRHDSTERVYKLVLCACEMPDYTAKHSILYISSVGYRYYNSL